MGNLNLATTEQRINGESFPYKKGILSIVIVGLFLGLAYGGLSIYEKKIVGQQELVDKSYGSEKATLVGNKNRDIVDLQNRTIIAKELINERFFPLESFTALEKSIVSGARLVLYDYERKSGKINLGYVADNFNIAARQILALKQSNFFSEVSLGKSGLDQNGKATFAASLKIKK